MPPAVPPLPPPMNMSTSLESSVSGWRPPTGRLLKPAVRVLTEWKNPASSLPGVDRGARVSSLSHSPAVMATVPRTSRARLNQTVIFVWSDHDRGPRQRRRSSISTGKPSPPVTTAKAMGRQTHGSVSKRSRLSGHRAKPALLNADTAWKSPWYAAVPQSCP